MNFTDVSIDVLKGSLSQQEVTVLMHVIGRTLDDLDPKARPNKGTFLLYGQREGEKASRILGMDLEDGGFCLYSHNEHDEYLVSDELAEKSIDAILTWPTQRIYDYEPEAEYFGKMPSGIYYAGRMKALVVNTTHGRFIASLQMGRVKRATISLSNINYYNETNAMLTGLAVALAEMRKRDLMLQLSLEQMKNRTLIRSHGEMYDKVAQMFAFCGSAELKEWKKWNRAATKDGISAFYFT